MSEAERISLKETIKRAMKISSQKLKEKKKALGLKIVISTNGKIQEVEPWLENRRFYSYFIIPTS